MIVSMKTLVVATVLFAAIWCAPATSQEIYSASFAPTPGSGSAATGVGSFTLNAAGTQLSYNISFSGLTSNELAAHFHRPDGSVAFGLPLGSPKVGVWNIGFTDVLFLQAEQIFVLIHSENNPGGEIRGNVMRTVPVRESTWGRIKATF